MRSRHMCFQPSAQALVRRGTTASADTGSRGIKFLDVNINTITPHHFISLNVINYLLVFGILYLFDVN